MNIYYLEEPLSNDDLTFVKEYIASEIGLSEIQNIKQIRVPMLLPTNLKTIASDSDLDSRINRIIPHLEKVGIKEDEGKQVFWVMPKTPFWGVAFQFAIEKATGFMPYVAQCWYHPQPDIDDGEHDEPVKGAVRILNHHAMLKGL